MSQEARKPMFDLKSADGAIGSHQRLVQVVSDEFQVLCEVILDRSGIARPDRTRA